MSRRNSKCGGTPPVAQEFEGVDLGDKRLDKRLKQIVASVSKSPDKPLPRLMSSRCELEVTYRFLGNDRVAPEAILAPHVEQSVARVGEEPLALVLHDTSEMSYSGEELREGLTWIRKGKQGFQLHVSLAVSADGVRRPLGVLGAEAWVRKTGGKKSGPEFQATKESLRWFRGVENAAQQTKRKEALVHVMDREADAYELLASMVRDHHRFIVRMAHDREVLSEEAVSELRIREAMVGAKFLVDRTVKLSKRPKGDRPPNARKKFAPREARIAHVRVKAMPLVIARSSECRRKDLPDSISLNLVQVIEVKPPKGAAPVEWLLLTTEPISTRDSVEWVVDSYRARWVIEEFFKALKTGCSAETRQLTSYGALLRATMIFLPIAWRLLLVRTVARTAPKAPAHTVVSDVELAVIRTEVPKLPKTPCARDVLLAIANMGGHLPNNGDPGWFVLARGAEKLALLCAGWRAAQAHFNPGSIG